VDFVRYAERAAVLLNTDVPDSEHVRSVLADRPWLVERVNDRDAAALRRLQRDLRPVFEASDAGDEEAVVDRLNALLATHPVSPFIAGHDSQSWHLHVSDRHASVADTLSAEALMGLAILVCDLGATRLGVCQDDKCDHVFVDTSPNRSRRYCSDRCSSRANVAAYRARRKAESAAGELSEGTA
jgi:predicted RNA-binding Zn ribbon-like protein